MKKTSSFRRVFLLLMLMIFPLPIIAMTTERPLDLSYLFLADFKEFRGTIVNQRTNKPLASAYLAVEGTNISTVTNSEGEFSLNLPDEMENGNIIISHLGFESRSLPIGFFKEDGVVIGLQETSEELSEVSLFTYTDPQALVRNMLRRRGSNYLADPASMTGFYRETIKRGRRNVSLSEAVVTIQKEPYGSAADDDIYLVKARKTADYDRLDTLALKLRGGPYNPLGMDIMKNPTHIFGEQNLNNFDFSFDEPTKYNDQYLYVVNFEELDKNSPWYYGKLFIDAETFTLVKAAFKLDVSQRSEAADLFVKEKPGGTKVFPVEVEYDIEYRERNGKWYYGYGVTHLEFVVNWKRKLFNSRYTVNSEMAVTDWEVHRPEDRKNNDEYIDPGVVMTDDISGFADIGFWGENNIIEPDKSIENAIEKIKERLENR